MSHPNYGKDFEKRIAEAMLRVADVDVQRLYDTTNGYIGVHQPADYIVYKYPHQYYIECKCTWENTLHKDYIPQLDDLYKKSQTDGIIAGVIVWFIKHNYTAFISVKDLVRHFQTHKSINIKELNYKRELTHIEIFGEKRRVFFDYDMGKFFSCFDS